MGNPIHLKESGSIARGRVLAYRHLKREDEAQREFTLARELNKAEREDLEQKVQGEERKKKP